MAFIIAALSLAATAASAAEPAWQAAETAHFIIYSKGSQQRLEKLATDLESFDQLMRMATGIRPDLKPVKVRIYEVDGLQEIQAALGLDSNSGIAGFYESNSLGPYLVTPRKTGFEGEDFGPGLVLHHEYAHHFMLQYFPASYPGWYTEGFAELIGSSKTLPDGSIGYGMPAKHRGHEIAAYWVPLQEVLTKEDIRDLDTYAQGWAMTHFFTFDRTRAAQLREYLAALKAGKSLAESAKVFGDLGALNQQARAYVLGGTFSYKPVKVEIVSPAVQRFRTVSPGEAALIPEVIAFRDADLNEIKKPGWRERERKLRETNLRRTREQVQRFPNDPFALSFLAEAEFLSGNYAQSEAAADRLLAIDPNNVRGLARKAIAMAVQARSLPGPAKAARIAEARRLAVRANKLDTEDPMPLLAYYQSFHAAGQSAPPIAVEGLMQAVSTMPRDTNSRLLLVDELASQHRWVEAIAWLVPFANALDDSPLRDSIREKLAWLRAQYAKEKGAAAAKS
jgi:tetratricopeptide (TPR) repeat protein